MANDVQIIGAKVQLDTGNSSSQLNAVKKSAADAGASLKETGNTAAATGKQIEESTGSFGKLKEQMAALPGPLGQAGEGVSKLSGTFKALLLNPVVATITLIVAALGFLYKSFTNTFEGGEKVKQVFAGITAAAGVVLDRIFDLGGAIIKFFSGDFTGAFESAKKAVTGIGAEIANTYNQVSQLTKKLQDIHKEELQDNLDQAKRAKDLAVLREQAYDESVPAAKRLKLLKELSDAQEEDSRKDIQRTKEKTAAQIALLSIGTDAAKKNQDEINKLQVDQINAETDAANESRRIQKSLTQAQKQELEERKKNAKEAAEEAKKNREQLEAYNSEFNKLQQQNALAGITDQYKKEQVLLENKITDESNRIKKEFEDKKITRDQYNKLEIEQQKSAQLQRDALTEKHNKDVQTKEQAFQEKLVELQQKVALDGIVDTRTKEAAQLEIEHEKELAQAIKDYKDDAAKLAIVKALIDADYRAKKAAQDEKNRVEDAKKEFEASIKKNGGIIDSPGGSYKEKIAALDADVAANKKAFDEKTISEAEYNANVAVFAEKRKQIRKEELANIGTVAANTADLLDTVSEAVGQNTAAGKALAIAAATIKALQAEITIIAGMSELGPFGFAAGIAAAAAVGVGLFNTIKKIESVQVPGQASGGSSGISGGVPSAPVIRPALVQTSTTLNQATIDRLSNAQATNPARAYIVEADVQSAADRNARLEQAARLGN